MFQGQWLRLRAVVRDAAVVSDATSSALDFARWTAALFVLLFHVRFNIFVDPATDPQAYAGVFGQAFLTLTNLGPVAVLWFFVISGYWVGGGALVQIASDEFDFRRYFENRAARLYLVLIPAILVGVALDGARLARFDFLPSGAPGDETAASYSVGVILGNLAFLQDLLVSTAGSNIPLWSLAYEGWLYLIFPLLAAIFIPRLGLPVRLALLAIGLVLLGAGQMLNHQFIQLTAAWMAGVAARIVPFRPIRWTGLAWLIAIAVSVTYPFYHPIAPVGRILVPLAVANLILSLRADQRVVNPSVRAFNHWAASFSFSLYLCHAPMLHFMLCFAASQADPRLNLQPGWAAFGTGLVVCAVLILYGWAFATQTEHRTAQVLQWLRSRGASNAPASVRSDSLSA